jgi:hypothetical protein
VRERQFKARSSETALLLKDCDEYLCKFWTFEGLFRHPRVHIGHETVVSFGSEPRTLPVCDIGVFSRSRSRPTSQRRRRRARATRTRPFVRTLRKRIEEKETTVVLTPLCRRQRRKDVSAETFSDRRGASRASRRRESRGNHDPARDRRDGRCGNARGREVRGCDAMILFLRVRDSWEVVERRVGVDGAGGVIVRSRFWIARRIDRVEGLLKD